MNRHRLLHVGRDPILGDGYADGHPHERTPDGFCTSCGAARSEWHYRLRPRQDDEPIYRGLVRYFDEKRARS